MNASNIRALELNDLPRHSAWPGRLLGMEPFAPRSKTKGEIDREFEREKWGALLAAIREAAHPWRVADADRYFLRDLQATFSCGEELRIGPAHEVRTQFLDVLGERVVGLLEQHESVALVELGAGYGSVLLNLAQRPVLGATRLLAAEYTASGTECLRLLASSAGQRVDTGRCDFSSPALCDLDIPAQSLIYTCMATPYVRRLEDHFIDALLQRQPAVVAHFEPCAGHYGTSLLGLMRTKYLHLNDYNENLLELLHAREARGDIRIVREEPCFFGENCLLPCSFVAWMPR